MNKKTPMVAIATAMAAVLALCHCSTGQTCFPDSKTVRRIFGTRTGTLVMIDCATRQEFAYDKPLSEQRLPPCSTFKIWNSLLGLKLGLIQRAEQPFYAWDGVKRAYPGWNRDLSLEQAFRVSCVPAYRALARKIGTRRMGTFITNIGYGDRDTTAGLDCFWLPAADRKTILISAREQARLLLRLLRGELPFAQRHITLLRHMMRFSATEKATLYGKTGSGTLAGSPHNLGWYVGLVESRGRRLAFACAILGKGQSGQDARQAVVHILKQSGRL